MDWLKRLWKSPSVWTDEDVIRFYREMGFFQDGDLTDCMARLLGRFEEDYGEPFSPADSPAELPQECHFRACTVNFSSEITLPSYDSQSVERLDLVEAEQDMYIRHREADRGEGDVMHRMLGHPDQIQGDMTLECQLASHGIYLGNSEGFADPRRASLENGADEWQLLLQIDSDEENLGATVGGSTSGFAKPT